MMQSAFAQPKKRNEPTVLHTQTIVVHQKPNHKMQACIPYQKKTKKSQQHHRREIVCSMFY
jgi:hypothetical protein